MLFLGIKLQTRFQYANLGEQAGVVFSIELYNFNGWCAEWCSHIPQKTTSWAAPEGSDFTELCQLDSPPEPF